MHTATLSENHQMHGTEHLLGLMRQTNGYDEPVEVVYSYGGRLPADLEPLDDRLDQELFLAAVEGQDAEHIEGLGSFRAPDGLTWTHTRGDYGPGSDPGVAGQPCTGWHVRDADGEFVEFIAEADATPDVLIGGYLVISRDPDGDYVFLTGDTPEGEPHVHSTLEEAVTAAKAELS
jgi:hypothetical protein